MLPGRPPTAEEARYLDDACSLGCILCMLGYGAPHGTYSPAEPHHTDGKTKPGCHFKIIPLCPRHHRIPGHGYVGRADGKKAFEAAYMSEEDLIEVVKEAVRLKRENTIGRRT